MEKSREASTEDLKEILDRIEEVGEALIEAQGRSLPMARAFIPSKDRFNYSDPHAKARLEAYLDSLEQGSDFYFDLPSGFLVMTALKHIKRGYCCDSGCRHCPYVAR